MSDRRQKLQRPSSDGKRENSTILRTWYTSKKENVRTNLYAFIFLYIRSVRFSPEWCIQGSTYTDTSKYNFKPQLLTFWNRTPGALVRNVYHGKNAPGTHTCTWYKSLSGCSYSITGDHT